MSKCTWYRCTREAKDKKYCFLHEGLMKGSTKTAADREIRKQPIRKPIAKVSEKRKVINKEYKKIVTKALADDPRCKVKSPVCTQVAQGLHHKQKRSPSNLTKASNLIECCNACNLYIEENPVWAKENGHTISRFVKS